MDSERLDRLRQQFHQKLIERGEKERLVDLLKSLLLDAGFNEKLLILSKNYVKDKGVDTVTISDIIRHVTPEAKKMVPDHVKRELLENIRRFAAEEMSKTMKD